MPPPRIPQRSLIAQFQSLALSRPQPARPLPRFLLPTQFSRPFSSTPAALDWLTPTRAETKKSRKGRVKVQTGGSLRGTTVEWGDYGLRMRDHHRRISAAHFKIAEETIRKRLRGVRYRLYKRVAANIGVYTSGNEQRMGKGKGSFDYWAARVPVSRIIFELKGEVHEQVVRDAFRLAGNKLPGQYEFVKKGEPPVMGITKLGNGVTMEDLLRPRKKIAVEETAMKLPVDVPASETSPHA